MRRIRRFAWSAAERRELWDRWRQGQGLVEIARALSRPTPSVQNLLTRNGGIAPPVRRRSLRVLQLPEREEISRGLAGGMTIRRIAQKLGRAPSTVSREVRRHEGMAGYRACEADLRAWERARRPKRCKLVQQRRLREAVAKGLMRQWSPQQISAWLERRYAGDETMRVSHETIYRTLFLQARGALKKELLKHLRTQRQMRRPQHATQTGGQIRDAISIRERPAEAEDRAVPGHWEGDLLEGSKGTQIATLVERHSRFVMLVKMKSKGSEQVAKALSKHILKLPATLRRSITWDRGSELAAHKTFSIATDVKVYFCDPHSPWQRGSNENTNGLLRQYFPKGADLSKFSQRHLDMVAKRLNQRPRQTLGWENPADTLQRAVASTG
ncbi:MAG TPA: IS30 family transposase [Steroidobacteraceae bacterium]|nr:IS30 family transposase [Steroidobacteraceae bacterium]